MHPSETALTGAGKGVTLAKVEMLLKAVLPELRSVKKQLLLINHHDRFDIVTTMSNRWDQMAACAQQFKE